MKLASRRGQGEANVAKVKVSTPKQLPSPLTTLQKACPAAVFEANPAGCPAASVVGVVRRPRRSWRSLSGPVYFVSHGGEAFPNLIMVLQGEGVRVDLVGRTFIKAGITSSTFKTVPDVPVKHFELYLPQGPTSALTTNGDLCKGSPVMPTTFVAQNGAEQENMKIAVTGCGKTTKTTTKAKASKRRRARPEGEGEEAQGRRRAGPAGRRRRARRHKLGMPGGREVQPRPGEEVMTRARRLLTAGLTTLGIACVGLLLGGSAAFAAGVPLVTTGAAQNMTRTTATLAGTVNPEGVETTYRFAYISEAGYQAALAAHAANPYAEGEATAPLARA